MDADSKIQDTIPLVTTLCHAETSTLLAKLKSVEEPEDSASEMFVYDKDGNRVLL